MVLLILTNIFLFIYLIKRIQKNVSKNNITKGKKDYSDFKLECGEMLVMKFCEHGSNFRRKFQAVYEYAFR